MRKIKYNIPVYEDEDIADLKKYSEEMAEAIKKQVDKFGNPLVFKGIVPTLTELQAITNATNGEIYAVIQENKNYIWNGTSWEIYSNNAESINTTSDIIVSPTEPTTDRRRVWLQKGKNVFNGSIVDGYGLNEDGATYGTLSRAITDFIPIVANCNYCFSGATFKVVCIYDKDKNFISSLNGSLVNTFSAPSNAKYVRLAFDNTVDYSNLQVELGEEITEFQEYKNNAIYVKNDNGVYEEFIKKEEKNIITASLANEHTIESTTVEKLVLCKTAGIGNELKMSNGGIKIGKGIKNIKATGQIFYAGNITSGDVLGIYIFKNNATIKLAQEKVTGATTLALSEYLIEVQEGDIIYLYARDSTNKGAVINIHSFLTVEAV